MIKILIVDDERIDREGVSYLLKKFEFPVEIHAASSVDEALDIIRQQDIQILFTDICMPGKSGLDLIREAKEICPAIRCVIYSAHGEFEYAKQAMQHEVKYYILKPMKVEEFHETIQSVLNEIMLDFQDDFKEQVLRLILGNTKEPVEFSKPYQVFLLDVSRPLFADSLCNMEGMIEEKFGDVICVSLNEYQAVVFLNNEAEALEKLALEFFEKLESDKAAKVTIVLGGLVSSSVELLKVYSRMEDQLEAKFFTTKSQVLSVAASRNAGSEEYLMSIQDMESYIRRNEKMRALSQVEILFQDLEKCNAISPLYVKYLCTNIVHCCTEVNKNLSVEMVSAYVDRVFHCSNIYELKTGLADILDEALEDMTDDNHSVIDQVIQIVEQEYKTDISLEQIADRVFLSPSYLSYYFKKETGKNFVKYLTVYRLEKAKELLRTTDIKVVTISEMVGYLNSSYFCLLFKNYTGTTPIKYREESVGCVAGR